MERFKNLQALQKPVQTLTVNNYIPMIMKTIRLKKNVNGYIMKRNNKWSYIRKNMKKQEEVVMVGQVNMVMILNRQRKIIR